MVRALGFCIVCCSIGAVGSARAADPGAARAYEQARRPYFALKASKDKQRLRHHWLKAIASFDAVASAYPDSPQAARALYTSGELWSSLHLRSHRADDLDHALTAYGRVASEHPADKLADDALWREGQLALRRRNDRATAARVIQALLAHYPDGDMAKKAKALWPQLANAAPKRTEHPAEDNARPLLGRKDEGKSAPILESVRHWSNESYSRVALYLSGAIEVREEGQAGTAAAPQIVINLIGARLTQKLDGLDDLHDSLLAGAELEPADDGLTLRLSLKHAAQHRFLVLENPYRVVVDAFTPDADAQSLPLAQTKRVVIDAGHGGSDSGARAADGLLEKDVTLAIAKETEALLVARGIEVVLTRDDDRRVSLEERTAIANRAGASLFVSIHANAHKNATARGIETYYLNTTDNRYALRLAARENATKEEQVSDVQLVLADLATKMNTRESRALAVETQRDLVNETRELNPHTRNLGVKGSLFYVLLGARMPAVLVETAFLSNPEESKLLGSTAYRHATAEAIADGVTSRLSGPIVAVQR